MTPPSFEVHRGEGKGNERRGPAFPVKCLIPYKIVWQKSLSAGKAEYFNTCLQSFSTLVSIPLAASSLLCISKTVDAQTQMLLKEVTEKICKGMLEGFELQHCVISWASSKCAALCSTEAPAPAQLWVLRPFFQDSLLGHSFQPFPGCEETTLKILTSMLAGGKRPRDGEGEAHSVSATS